MKNKITILLLILISFSNPSFSKEKTKEIPVTKKKFTFEDAVNFKYVKTASLSYYGKWASFEALPDWGDGYLKVVSTSDTNKKYVFDRGTQGKFSNDENWFVCLIQPKSIEIENAKTPKDKPKNSLKYIELGGTKTKDIDKVKKFLISENSKWLIYEQDTEIEKDKKLKFKPLGSNIALVHLKSGTEIEIDNVYNYQIDSLSKFLFYSISSPDGKTDGIYYRNLNEEFAPEYLIEKREKTIYSDIEFSDSSKVLAYLSTDISDDGTPKECALKFWNEDNPNLVEIAVRKEDVQKDWFIYYKNELKFTKDGRRLWIGLKPISEKYLFEKPERKFNDTNFVNLDTIQANSNLLLWHYKDPRIMTFQQTNWNQLKDKTYPAVFDFNQRKLIQIADLNITQVEKTSNPDYTIGYDENPYLVPSTWESSKFDLYKINLKTGEKRLIESKLEENANLSPDGNYVVFYKDSSWYVYETKSERTQPVNVKMQNVMYDEEHDTPDKAPSYGFAGWFENSKRFMLYDRYDIWMFTSDLPQNRSSLTATYGRVNKIRFRIQEFKNDREYYSIKDTLFLNGFNTKSKWSNFYYQDFKILGSEKLTYDTTFFNRCWAKAKGNNSALVSKENFATFPDLSFYKNIYDKDDSSRIITNINPQMGQYSWGTTQLIEWKDSQGNDLQGFIMKPANFDIKKRYPVIIHFYEKFSDEMYRFQRPALNHRPSPIVYTNDDYVIFYPDIVFKVGYPGYSSVDALVSGSKKLIQMGIADSNAIGLQGHSWSGYQTAFDITQTDFFKAACAGAPVSNMTSAYSGIRLGSGLARQFQYEKQQSRIGGDLWDSLSNYLKNSPVFEAKGIHTPLLIEFGDIDDAVPWEQGIELYLALRRLGKEVFLLEYEKEPHILRKYYNKVDYAIKMKQFFDHYLKGKPAPEWLTKGIPYKGN